MDLRRGGEERRRRVLMDERAAAPTGAAPRPRSARSGRNGVKKNYSPAAVAEGQLRVVDLIATRRWSLLVMCLSALTVVAALATLYLYSGAWGRQIGPEHLEFLDLAGRSSLAGWFSTALLTLAAGKCLLIYSLRRYKSDDYRGRYRIWLWAAAALFAASVDAAAGWRSLLSGLGSLSTSSPVAERPEVAWMGLFVLAYGALATRLVFEMKRSRGGLVALAAAGACYAAWAIQALGLVQLQSPELAVLARAAASLCGRVAVLSAVALFGRFVYLDAHGALPARKATKVKASRTKTNGPESVATERAAGDVVKKESSPAKPAAAPLEKTPAAAAAKSASAPSAQPFKATSGGSSAPLAGKGSLKLASGPSRDARASTPSVDDDDCDEDAEGDDDSQRMSKAERRRQRKELRRDKRSAA